MKQVLNTNGIDRTQALWQYVTGQNIPAWNPSSVYAPGDTVIYGSLGWYCTAANTDEAPSLSSPYWIVYDAVGTGARNLIIKDGYFIGPPVFYAPPTIVASEANWGAYPLVDGDYGISYQPYPTVPSQTPDPVINFTPFNIEKEKLTFKTGFESSNLSLVLRPREPDPLTSVATGLSLSWKRGKPTIYGYPDFSEGLQTNAPYSDMYAYNTQLYQTMRQSFSQTTDWYLAPVTMYRFFMPTPGDTDTFGAAVMFRGRISEMQVDREDVKLTVSSLMEIFKQKVPTQTVQAGNRWAPFDFNSSIDYQGTITGVHGGGYNWIELNFGSAPSLVNGTLDEGWALVYHAASSGLWWRRIYTNQGTFINGSSQTISTVILIEPLPISLAGSGEVQLRVWKSSDTSTNPSGPGAGFPYVPQPFTGIS